MAEPENAELTPVQLIELQRLEALIAENLHRPCRPRLVRDGDGWTLPPEKAARHVQLYAELITFLAAEGLGRGHFRRPLPGIEYLFASDACSLLRNRRELFQQPDSFGCKVLMAAGFRPPPEGVSQTRGAEC